jgi:hypothetical protein
MTSDHVIALQTRLSVVYDEITNQLVANVQGQDSYVSEEESQKFTDELMKNMEIEFDESLLNKQINQD